MRVGGVPVAFTPQGFVAGGASIPVPLNSTLAGMLKATGITVEVVAAQQFADRVVAPALRVTFPLAVPGANAGDSRGTATVIIGSAMAQMAGVTSDSGLGATTGDDADSSEPTATTGDAASGTGLGTVGDAAGGSGLGAITDTGAGRGQQGAPSPVGFGADMGGSAGGLSAGVAAPTTATPATLPSAALGSRSPPTAAVALRLDVRSVYLVLLAGAVLTLGVGELIRRFGGRVWNSIGG
jgi:hypothetical protein